MLLFLFNMNSDQRWIYSFSMQKLLEIDFLHANAIIVKIWIHVIDFLSYLFMGFINKSPLVLLVM